MPDMTYDSGDLRDGAAHDRQSSDAADSAARKLGGAAVTTYPFGNVPTAGSFVSALSQAQQHHVAGAQSASTARDSEGQRADTTADIGDELTTTTTAVANQGTVRSVAEGMDS